MRKIWFIIAGIVIVVGIGLTAFILLNHQGTDSLTVSELRSQAESLYSQQVRVGGRVAPGSIDWDDKVQVMKFVLTDDKESLAVIYQGIVPDNFKPESNLVVVGKYGTDGVFEASGFGKGDSFCNACH